MILQDTRDSDEFIIRFIILYYQQDRYFEIKFHVVRSRKTIINCYQ